MSLDFSAEAVSSLISDIYDCALDPGGWNTTLTKINAALDGAYTALYLVDPRSSRAMLAAQSPWDTNALIRLSQEFKTTELPGVELFQFGDVDEAISTLQSLPEAEFQATRFYREWAGPQGLRDGCVLKFVHTAERYGTIAVTTCASRDIVSADERRYLALLSPHLRRAALIGDLLDYKRIETELFRNALDRLTCAVYLVDGECRITYANETGTGLLDDRQFVMSKGGTLTPANTVMANPLAEAVRRAMSNDLGGRGIGIPMTRPGDAPAVAYVLPLGTGAVRSIFRSAAAAVFISTTVSTAPPPQDVLATLYDLTPAETRTLIQIGTGLSITDSAIALKVSENTIKSHLGRLYSKLGTSRQADLVAIVSGLAPPINITSL